MTGRKIDISLVVSLYRSAGHLPQFTRHLVEVADVMAQKDLGLQIIVVANAPTTLERWLVSRMCREARRRGTAVTELLVDRETLYASWNRGLSAAEGDCLGFWNCDDVRNPLALVDGLTSVRAGADVVYFRVVELRMGSLLWPSRPVVTFHAVPEFDRALFRRGMFAGPFFLVSRHALHEVGPFDSQFRIAGDFDWCARAAESLEFRLASEIGGTYVRHSRTLSGGSGFRQVAENNVVYVRSGAYDKLVQLPSGIMNQYKVDLPWRTFDVPDSVLRAVFESEAKPPRESAKGDAGDSGPLPMTGHPPNNNP